MKLTNLLFFAFLTFRISGSVLAQSPNLDIKSDKQVKLMIITEENGKKTIIDTTFTTADEATISAYLKNKGANDNNMPFPTPPSPPTAPTAPTVERTEKELSRQYEYRIVESNTDKQRDNHEIQVAVDTKELDSTIDEARKQLESSLKKTSKLNKAEIKMITDEFDENMKELKSKAKEEKKVIIIRKDKKSIDK